MTGVKYGLDATSNVDEKASCVMACRIYRKRVWEANQPIIDLVKSRGALLHAEKTEHSYRTAGAATIRDISRYRAVVYFHGTPMPVGPAVEVQKMTTCARAH